MRFLLLLALWCCMYPLAAQTTFSELSEMVAKLRQTSPIQERATFDLKKRAVVAETNAVFTERVRMPDLCTTSSARKYYYIRNVKTGEYLHYSGGKSTNGSPEAVPLTTVAAPDEGSVFFFYRGGIVLGSGYGLCNSVSSSSYTLKDLDTYEWEATGTNAPTFQVKTADSGNGLYIYNSETIDDVSVYKYWRYDAESGTVRYGDTDEYAEWVFECIPHAPQVSDVSVKQDTLWYVVRNTSTGKYLRYNEEERLVNTVMAPDSCSLFFFVGESMSDGADMYNYAARGYVESGLKIIETEENRYFISKSGDISGGDIYNADENGDVNVGGFGVSSEWEFERVYNFREIFGHQFESEVEMLMEEELTKIQEDYTVSYYRYYMVYVALYYALLTADSDMDLNHAARLAVMRAEAKKILLEYYDPEEYTELSIYNIGHVDNDSNVIRKNLATNSELLIVNDVDNVHANVWQMWFVGEGSEKYPIIYNVATKKYLKTPVIGDDGTATVGMTSSLLEAGTWSVSTKEVLSLKTVITSIDCPNYYLQLKSPDSTAVSCVYFESEDSAKVAPGAMWEFVFVGAVIDEEFYGHAADAVVQFTDILQTQMGMVKDGCEQYSSNFPSADAMSSTCHLTDGEISSVFRTEGAESEEPRYLLADMGENTKVGNFYFYVKPNLKALSGIPASVTIEASNAKEDGFVVLAENVELTRLLENMYYFSPLIMTGENTYRYLRFTINGVVGDEDARDFTMSEFYVLPDDGYTAQAKSLMDGFYACDYLSEEILYPAVELVKLKATYLLGLNENNHSENPGVGQYPTSKYNALAEAVTGVSANDMESVNRLQAALEVFINSIVNPVFVMESAWEDGFSKDKALMFDDGSVYIQQANIWDIRQWVTLKEVSGGTFLKPMTFSEEIPYNVNVTLLDGWKNLYASQRDAYSVSIVEDNTTLYMTVNEDLYIDIAISAPTTTSNQNAAWYFTQVGNNAVVETVDDAAFVEALADFGLTFARAKVYEEGYLSGLYVYNESAGLTKTNFDDIYAVMNPYYQAGPMEALRMRQSGEIGEEMVQMVNDAVAALKLHFPNFVVNVSAGGYYYRLRGSQSGNYLLSDINADGSLAMSEMSDDGDVVAKSIFYASSGTAENSLNVMSFDNGRYLKAESGQFAYDNYPLDYEAYASQDVFVNGSLAGTSDSYSVAFGSDNDYCLSDGGTVATPAAGTNDLSFDWTMEIVEELPITVSSAMMTSLCVPVELQIPDGVTVYILTGKDVADGSHKNAVDNEVYEPGMSVFNVEQIEVDMIPAGMPVLLKATEGTYLFPINYNATDADKTEAELQRIAELQELNLLEGTHDARLISARANTTHHVLSRKNEKVGMYKVRMVSATDRGLDYVSVSTFLNPVHRAWLPYASEAAPVGFSLAVGGNGNNITDIEKIETMLSEDNVIYDIHGRRLIRIVSPGFYIVNGKKVLVK